MVYVQQRKYTFNPVLELNIRNCRSMKLSKLYNLFAACFEHVHCLLHSTRVRPRPSGDGGRKGQKRARRKSNSSLPCEAVHKTCYCSIAASVRVRSTLKKSTEQRSQKAPSNAAALNILKNAAFLIHAAKRLSEAKSPAMRLSYQKAHAKRVKRLTMRANVESACVSFLNTGKSIPFNRFVDGTCSNCLFSYYCDDKDKICLSVSNPYDFYSDNLDFQTDIL